MLDKENVVENSELINEVPENAKEFNSEIFYYGRILVTRNSSGEIITQAP